MSADDATGAATGPLPGRASLGIHPTADHAPDHRLITVGTDTGACEAILFDREDCSDVDAKAVIETLARELGVPIEAFRDE